VATILGLVAKEEVVGVFGTLSEMIPEGADLMGEIEGGINTNAVLIGQEFFDGNKLSAYSFMVFNLLCAPCFAAMGAIKREMNSPKWTAAAIGYMCVFAWVISLIIYQVGVLITDGVFGVWTVLALMAIVSIIYLLFRKNKYENKL